MERTCNWTNQLLESNKISMTEIATANQSKMSRINKKREVKTSHMNFRRQLHPQIKPLLNCLFKSTKTKRASITGTPNKS
jgi:predicted glycoside hydrolase/deacetylase ChbG (UPF0249 family)